MLSVWLFDCLTVWLFLWSKYVRILDCWPKGNVAFHSEIKGFVGFGWVLAHRHLLSFHIGQVGWRLRWYPLSSPSLHQFSYCRPQVPGWRASNTPEYLPNTPENASQHISHISDNSLRCDAPPKSLLLLQEISYLGKIHYFILILSESVLI